MYTPAHGGGQVYCGHQNLGFFEDVPQQHVTANQRCSMEGQLTLG